MTFVHEGVRYRLDFNHDLYNPPLAFETQHRGTRLIQAMTTCAVWERPEGASPEAEVVYAMGHAKCSVDDRFVKATARELAVRRAADAIGDRELRGKVLAAYFTRTHKAV
jgi:hypothetical protein